MHEAKTMSEDSPRPTRSINNSGGEQNRPAAIYVQAAWGVYERAVVVQPGAPVLFKCADEHGTIVEVTAADPHTPPSLPPVTLACAATGLFTLSDSFSSAFARLEAGRLPRDSRDEQALIRSGKGYSLPLDLYPADLQAFMDLVYRSLSECAQRTWRLLRWRTGALSSHRVFDTVLQCRWSRDGRDKWLPFPRRAVVSISGHIVPDITESIRSSVEDMLKNHEAEPVSDELLREAWSLRSVNPRAALLLAIAAAEVGLKETFSDLVPQVEWMTTHIQTPPIDALLLHALPQLPVRRGVAAAPPDAIRQVLKRAIEARNALAHRGEFNQTAANSDQLIQVVRELLQQFAYYRGVSWASPSW